MNKAYFTFIFFLSAFALSSCGTYDIEQRRSIAQEQANECPELNYADNQNYFDFYEYCQEKH